MEFQNILTEKGRGAVVPKNRVYFSFVSLMSVPALLFPEIKPWGLKYQFSHLKSSLLLQFMVAIILEQLSCPFDRGLQVNILWLGGK